MVNTDSALVAYVVSLERAKWNKYTYNYVFGANLTSMPYSDWWTHCILKLKRKTNKETNCQAKYVFAY